MSSAEVRVFPADLRVETDDHQVAQMASLHVCQETTEPLTVMPYDQQHLCLYRNQPFITCSTPTTMDKMSSKRSWIAVILSIVVLMTTKQHPCYHGQTLDTTSVTRALISFQFPSSPNACRCVFFVANQKRTTIFLLVTIINLWNCSVIQAKKKNTLCTRSDKCRKIIALQLYASVKSVFTCFIGKNEEVTVS